MSFKDYSLVPASNTSIGGDIYIGPNMERAKVRPALQQLAADGREAWDHISSVSDGLSASFDALMATDGRNILAEVQAKSAVNVTISNPGTAVFDGVTLTSGQRVLIGSQSAGAENGIYVFNGSGVPLTRATDFDQAGEVSQGSYVRVLNGATQAGSWVLATPDPITVGATAQTWNRFDTDPLATLRQPAGSSNVAFIQTGIGAGARTAEAKMRDTVNAYDFGAIGDGAEHKLSTVYATLAEAQARYPFAASLNDTFDFCAIQAALNFVEPFRGCVSLEGRDDTTHLNRFVCNRALSFPSYVTLDGGSSWGATLDNQTYPLSDNAHFVNKDPATCNYITLRNLVVNGGDYGMKIGVTISCEGWTLENVSFQLNTVNCIGVNKQLYTSSFTKCRFADAPIGFSVAAATTNAVDFYGCEWLSNSQTCLYLRGAEGVNIYGGRMEAGGIAASGTIDLDNAGPVTFHGVYFENTSENILLETNSRDGVAFMNCHFSGWTPGGGGLTAYKVTSNGKVTFVGPHAPLGITGLAKGVLSGPGSKNVGTSSAALYSPGGRGVSRIISGEAALPNESGGAVTVPLFTFTRAGSSGATSNVQMVTGRLRVDVIGVASGGFDVAMFYDFPIAIYAVGIGTIVAVVGTADNAIAGSATLAVSAVAGATTNSLTLKAVISGFTTSTALAKRIRFSFDGKDQSANETDRFTVDLA